MNRPGELWAGQDKGLKLRNPERGDPTNLIGLGPAKEG